MKKENVKSLSFLLWLFFFLAPIVVLMSPHAPMDSSPFAIYFIFVLPVLWLLFLLLDIFLVNKKKWKIVLFKYVVSLLVSYLILGVYIYFNLRIGPGL